MHGLKNIKFTFQHAVRSGAHQSYNFVSWHELTGYRPLQRFASLLLFPNVSDNVVT